MRRVQIEEEGDLVNLTPLLDVLFLILIFFILIAPLLDFDRIHLAPSSDTKQELSALNESASCKIYVQNDNSLFLGTQAITLSDLSLALKNIYEKSPQTIPQLYPDRNASFGTYQTLKNLIESIGFKQLDVVLKNE